MPAFAVLQLKNQAASEVSYQPADIDPATGVARWLGAGAVYDARTQVTSSVVYPKTSGTKVRVKGKISVPLMDPLDATKKIDEAIATIEFAIPKGMALAARQDLRASIADLLIDNTIVKAIEEFESTY